MDFASLQPHQCFFINKLRNIPLPWHMITTALKNVITFEHTVNDLHTSLHKHGNVFFHRLIEVIPAHLLSADINQLVRVKFSIPLVYRHVWIRADRYNVQIVHRGTEWFDCEDKCRQSGMLHNARETDVLSIESVCSCYIIANNDHQDIVSMCRCVCHTRPCTHHLSDHVPKLSSCGCLDPQTTTLNSDKDNRVQIHMAPWKRRDHGESMYIFFIPQKREWFTSQYKDIATAYKRYNDNIRRHTVSDDKIR